jgi:hypothetical protein
MKKLFGGILIACGILLAGVSGLCTLVGLISGLGDLGSTLSMLPLVLLYGGIPFAGGVALVIGGRTMIRQAREEK